MPRRSSSVDDLDISEAEENQSTESVDGADEEPADTPLTDCAKVTIVCLLTLLVFVAFGTIGAASSYGHSCWKGLGAGPNETFNTKIKGLVVTVIDKLRGKNQTILFSNETLIPQNHSHKVEVTGLCPVNGTCPVIKGCREDTNSCIPQPKPPCISQSWLKREGCLEPIKSCPIGTCPPPKCEPLNIQAFRSSLFDTRTVYDWITMYPPNSPERLEVVTTLLSKSMEEFAVLGHFHRCLARADQPLHSTICSFCNDRYEYIRCVMANDLEGQLYPDPPSANYLVPIFWTPELSELHARLVRAVIIGESPQILDPVFDRIRTMIRPFSLKIRGGGECRVCKDFDVNIYDRCYKLNNWYVRPEHRA